MSLPLSATPQIASPVADEYDLGDAPCRSRPMKPAARWCCRAFFFAAGASAHREDRFATFTWDALLDKASPRTQPQQTLRSLALESQAPPESNVSSPSGSEERRLAWRIARPRWGAFLDESLSGARQIKPGFQRIQISELRAGRRAPDCEWSVQADLIRGRRASHRPAGGLPDLPCRAQPGA